MSGIRLRGGRLAAGVPCFQEVLQDVGGQAGDQLVEEGLPLVGRKLDDVLGEQV
jgi:hypothetical protein